MTRCRTFRRACSVILLGALLNIAVALACALWSPLTEYAISLAPAHVPGDVRRQVPGLSATRRAGDSKPMTFVCRAQAGFGVGAYRIDVNPWFTGYLATDAEGASGETTAVFAAGWPVAVLSSRIIDISMDRGWEGGSISMGSALALSPRLFETPDKNTPRHWQTRPLPYGPLWRGLLVGTAFYSLALVGPRWFAARLAAARTARRSAHAASRPRPSWALMFAALLLGSILNLCIATAAALWSPVPTSEVDVFIDPLPGGLVEGWDTPLRAAPDDSQSWTPYLRSRQRGVGVTLLGGISVNQSAFRNNVLYVVHSGWPFRSLSARCKILAWGSNPTQLERGAEAPDWLAPQAIVFDPAISRYITGTAPALTRPLPLRLHWYGSIANSVVYGVIFFVLARILVAWLTRARRRPGACRSCGYTVNNLGICPECGTPASGGASQ